MPQQTTGGTYFDPTDGKIHLASGEVAPQGQQPPPINAARGTSLPKGPSLLQAPPSLGKDPNAKDPSLRGLADNVLTMGEIAGPFGAAAFPPAAPLLPAFEAALGGAQGALRHPESPGWGAAEGGAYQAGLSFLPKVISNALANGGNRVALAMRGVENELPTGEKLTDVFNRIRQDTRRMFPGQDTYGQAEAQKQHNAMTAPKPGDLPPGAVLPPPNVPKPTIGDIVRQGTGMRIGRNTIPVGAEDRFVAAQKRAGEQLGKVEEGSMARVPLERVLDPKAQEVQDLRTKVDTRNAHAPLGQDEITKTVNKLRGQQGGRAYLRGEDMPLSAGQQEVNAYRDMLDSQRKSFMGEDFVPLTDAQFNEILLKGKTIGTRELGNLTRDLRGRGPVTKIVEGRPVSPSQDLEGQTNNAYAQRGRSIQEQVNPLSKPANARESDLFKAVRASQGTANTPVPSINIRRGMPNYINPGLAKAITGFLFPRAGNLAASTVEAAPLLLRLTQLFDHPEGQ